MFSVFGKNVRWRAMPSIPRPFEGSIFLVAIGAVVNCRAADESSALAYPLLEGAQRCMISALFSQPNYVAAKRLLDGTVLRHEAIASNLANLETPHYKRLDVAPSFATSLRQAVASRRTSQIETLRPRLEVDGKALAQNRDGNTVQLETELGEMNKNFLAHALETQLITGSLLKLRLAITGRTV
jgi:flagellar basal-body rod protein FlgB